MIQHSEECIAADAEMKRIHDEWVRRWPLYCRECNGWGGHYSTFDPSPAGVSLSSGTMEEYDPCMFCTEEEGGICPRCGCVGELDLNERTGDIICKGCGWDSRKPDACPPDARDYPCSCELEQERKDEAEWLEERKKTYQEMIDEKQADRLKRPPV